MSVVGSETWVAACGHENIMHLCQEWDVIPQTVYEFQGLIKGWGVFTKLDARFHMQSGLSLRGIPWTVRGVALVVENPLDSEGWGIGGGESPGQ